MKYKNNTYRTWFAGYLSLILSLIAGVVSANGDQNLISLTSQSFGSELGDVTPSIVYNSDTKEYLAVYSKADGTCQGKERLFGVVINAVTGEFDGSSFSISDCNNSILEPKVIYNTELGEYLVFYKSINDFGNYSNLKFASIDGSSHSVETTPVSIESDPISDPFNNLVISYDSQTDQYGLGYHKKNAQSESALVIEYVNATSKALTAHNTTIDKSTFIEANKGVFETNIVFNGTDFVVIFELKYVNGSEIWGSFVDPSNGTQSNFFQISPDGVSDKFYVNPGSIINPTKNEIIITYEESYFSDTGGEYVLSDTLRVQKVSSLQGSLINPENIALPPLAGSFANNEDKKKPKTVLSQSSKEIVMPYYGIRFVSGSDKHNLYLDRLNSDDLTSISSGTPVATSVGRQVIENTHLKSIEIIHNEDFNQFLLCWYNETNNEAYAQIWRYDNNSPTNLQISNSSIAEEMAIGTTVGIISADDPDPEDSQAVFTLVSGTGSTDNSFFLITGNELKVAKNLSFEDANFRNIRIRATDSHGGFTELPSLISIININEAPHSLSLAGPLSVEENLSSGTFSAAISVNDDDIGNTHTFSLIAGDSATNNSNFVIDQGYLILVQPLNYEDTSKQYVRIKATDNTGLFDVKAFTIEVTDVNEGPEKIELSPPIIPENDPESSLTVMVIDPDEYSNYVLTEATGEGDDDNDIFDLSGNILKPLVPLNYEEKQSYSVRLRAYDGVYDTEEVFTIYVSDMNDDPDSVKLNENRIETGLLPGTTVGQLITFDQDVDDTHTYKIIGGDQFFFINGSDLNILNSLEYNFSNPENNFYNVQIESTDAQGGVKIATLSIEVVLVKDDEKPEIQGFNDITKNLSDQQSQATISVAALDNVKLDTAYFFYRPIRSLNAFEAPNQIEIDFYDNKTRANIDVFINASDFDAMGIEYYFKAVDEAGNTDSTSIGYMYRSYANEPFKPVNKSFNGDAVSYKIISNPYFLENNKVSKIFSDYASSESWRLFKYENDEYKEIGDEPNTYIEQGKGYWFNKDKSITAPIEFDHAYTPENNKENTYTITLNQGWNLIGNPYPFDLNWEYVIESNGFSSNEYTLYTFDKQYDTANALNEFEGGFVFAATRVEIDVPIEDPNFSGSRIANQGNFENGWLVNLTLENSQYKNNLSAFGMHDEAIESYDRFDAPLLPRFINHLDISFNHPEHFARSFSQDIVEKQENYIWEFIASTNFKKSDAILSWDIDLLKNNSNQLFIYDVNHDKVIDVRQISEYAFSLDQTTTFKAIYGTQAFLAKSLSKIRIEALQPYPNPFSESVHIPINLPYSSEAYDIECHIFNLMGEKVYEKNIENIDQGLFQLEWDESQNGNLDQGIYIYSIKVKNGLLTSNFHGRIVKN